MLRVARVVPEDADGRVRRGVSREPEGGRRGRVCWLTFGIVVRVAARVPEAGRGFCVFFGVPDAFFGVPDDGGVLTGCRRRATVPV